MEATGDTRMHDDEHEIMLIPPEPRPVHVRFLPPEVLKAHARRFGRIQHQSVAAQTDASWLPAIHGDHLPVELYLTPRGEAAADDPYYLADDGQIRHDTEVLAS
jgi:hypothetical protein